MKSLKTLVFVFVLVAVLLSACQPAPAPAAQPAQATQAPHAAEPTKAAEPAQVTEPTKAPEPAAGEPKKGGVAIIGTPQEPGTLNPLVSSASIESALSSFIIEGLVQIDADGIYAPVLAEALPTVSSDNLTVTYQLKKDVTFSNGDAFTCEDVQYTLEAILTSGASSTGYKDIEAVECPDPLTVVAKFKKIYAPYLRLFDYILPKSAGDPANADSWEYNRKPVGTGPWVISDWKAGDSLTLTKNPNYRIPDQPYLDSLIVKILPSREVGVQLLGTGGIHVLWDLVEADFPTLEKMKDQGVAYAAAQTGENELLVLNLADPAVDAPADPAAAPHPILSDPKVRQALEMAVDKELIVETLLSGNVKPGTTLLPNGAFACPLPPVAYDPAGAQALLDEAGWKAGADAIRAKDGKRLSLKITSTSGNQLREQTEQVLVEMYSEIGVELVIENVPSDTLFAGWADNGLRKHGKFDILLYTTGPFGSVDPDSHLFGNFHSLRVPSADNEGAGNNYSRYINADVDGWIDEAASITDSAKRKELYCNVAAQVGKDRPRIFLYERLLISGYNTKLQNFRVSPGPSDFTVGSENWWLK